MITINTNLKEMRLFNQYLDDAMKRPKTDNPIFEYFLKENINSLAYRIKIKVGKMIIDQREDWAKAKLQIEYRELAGLSIYLQRYDVQPFLKHLEVSIISKIPAEVIAVFKTGTHESYLLEN